MAEEFTDPGSEWGKYKVKTTSNTKDDWSGYVVPKKPVANGADLSGNSLTNLQQPTADLLPVLPQNRDEVRQRQIQDKQALSDRLRSLSSGLDAEHRKAFDKAQEIASTRPQDEVRQSTDKELQYYYFDQNPVGKVLNSINYLSSKATKGTLQVAKGAAWLADNATNYGLNEHAIDAAFQKADENTDFGLSKGTQQRMADNPVTANLGGLAEFLPAAAAASGTGGATLYLQGIGQGKESVDAAEKQSGKQLNPVVKNAFILGTGAVNGLLMGELGSSIFRSLPAGLRSDITASITADAIKEASGKELTGEAFKSLLDKGAKTFTDKLAKGGISTLEGYKHAVSNLGALTTANFALKKAADVANDAPVFNEAAGDLASSLNDVATKQAPFFALPAALGAATKLTPYSEYKNSVVETLMHDSSPENIERTKQDIANHGYHEGWRTEDIEGTLAHIDDIAKVAKSLPKNIPEHKLSDAVDLVLSRNKLQEELANNNAQKETLDPALKDIVPAGDQMMADKVEQANDKLKDIVAGTKTTYSKGIGEEEGKFFKKVDGGKPEEITPSRYELEAMEREARKRSADRDAAVTSFQSKFPDKRVDVMEDVPDSVGKTFDRIDNDLPTDPVAINETSDWLYNKYKQLSAMKKSDTRQLTVEQIDGIQKQLETDISQLENYKLKHHPDLIDEQAAERTPAKAEVLPNETKQIPAPIDEVGGSKEVVFKTSKGSVYRVHEDNTTTRDKSYHAEHGGDEGEKPRSSKTVYVTPEDLNKLDLVQANHPDDTKGYSILHSQDGKIGVAEFDKKTGESKIIERTVVKPKTKPEVGLTPVETWKGHTQPHFGNKIIEVNEEPVSKETINPAPKVEAEAPVIESPKGGTEITQPKEEKPSVVEGPKDDLAKAGDPLRAFADKVRQGKINKLGGFRASTGFDAVWDTSLEVVAKSIEGGAKIVDAIDAGLKHIKQTDWYKNLSNKDDFDKQYKEHLSNEYKTVEDEKTRPSKNEATGERAAELGVELKDAKEQTRSEDVVEKDASDKIKKGYDVPDLIDRIINKKHAATDTEVAILNKYIDTKETEIKGYNEQLAKDGATMGKRYFIDLMDAKTQAESEFQDAADANRKTGRLTAQALNARKFRFNKENSLENMVARKREALGGEKLTPEQLADITKRFSEMEGVQKQLEARVKKVEEQNAKLKAEKEVKRAIAEKPKTGITKEYLAKERQQISAEFSERLKKMRSQGLNDASKASVEFLQAAAPYVAKMTRNLAQEGVLEIKELVKRIKKELDIEDVDDIDVLDLIAGKYNEVKPTRSDLQDNIRSLRTQAKLIAEIERLENGIKTDKPEVVKKKNVQIEALRTRLKELNDESGEHSLSELKKRLQANIDKISQKIAAGDFSKEEPKKPVTPDAEALTLRRKYDRIKQEWDIEVAKDALKQRSKVEKLKDDLLNIASLPRALKASLDFSAVLRQGLFLTPAHPKEALTAFKEMFRQTFSEERYKNWISDLKHSEYYDLMKNSDLYLSDKNDPKLIAREEEFTSNLADKIPGIGKAIAASERAYTGYLNALRAGVFESQARELIKRGYTYENNPEVFKGMAKVVNVLTGRGDIPEVLGGKSPKVLSNLLFSPRFMAARIQTLYLWADPRLPKEAKIMAAKDISATLATGAVLLSLAALAGFKVNLDPRSSQFMKLEDEGENGSTFYDIMGGLPQYVRLLSQLASGTTVSASGNETDLSEPRGKLNPWGQTRGDVELRFMRGKLSPVVGSAINLQEGKDVVGNPYTFWPNVPQEFIPLPFTDVSEAYQVGGIKNALKVLVPSQFGIGVSSYQPK